MFEGRPAKGLGLISVWNRVADVIDGLADVGITVEGFINDHLGNNTHVFGGDLEHLDLYRVADRRVGTRNDSCCMTGGIGIAARIDKLHKAVGWHQLRFVVFGCDSIRIFEHRTFREHLNCFARFTGATVQARQPALGKSEEYRAVAIGKYRQQTGFLPADDFVKLREQFYLRYELRLGHCKCYLDRPIDSDQYLI